MPFLDILEKRRTKLIACSLYIVSLSSAIYYSLQKLIISSDTLFEYNTYLIYVDEKAWRPIVNNMLSSCLWTTYLPACIQNILKLDNPEIVFRIVGAVLVSFAPMVIFLLCRRFTRDIIALLLAGLFLTSFFYQIYTEYTRINLAMAFVGVLLLAITTTGRLRYVGIALSVIGLLLSHYTVANAYAIALVVSSGIIILLYFYKRQIIVHGLSVVIAGVILTCGVLVWYHAVPSVWQYSSSVVERSITEVVNQGKSIFIESGENQTDNITGLESQEVTVVEQREHIFLINFVLLSGNRLDFRFAKLLILLRMVISSIMVVNLWKSKKQWNAVFILYALIIGMNIITLWSGVIDVSVGHTRASYIFMPVELLGISYWWGKEKRSSIYLIPLILWFMIYH